MAIIAGSPRPISITFLLGGMQAFGSDGGSHVAGPASPTAALGAPNQTWVSPPLERGIVRLAFSLTDDVVSHPCCEMLIFYAPLRERTVGRDKLAGRRGMFSFCCCVF